MLVPGSLALISSNFPLERRGRAIGTWSGFTSITAAIGPVLGGWFIEHGSWRWAFFINVPLGLIVAALALWKIPESTGANQGTRPDWLGGLLAALGFGGIVFALIQSVPLTGAIGAVALLGMAYWEAHASTPMVPLQIFRSRNFTGANLLTLFLYSALGGVLFLSQRTVNRKGSSSRILQSMPSARCPAMATTNMCSRRKRTLVFGGISKSRTRGI
jgi:MFS family permease